MKLVSFQVPSQLSRTPLLGAVVNDHIIELNSCYASYLLAQGQTERYYEIADAVISDDMLTFLKGGIYAKQEAQKAIDHFLKKGVKDAYLGPRGELIVHTLESVTLLAPIQRPSSIRDTISFETHAKNFEKRTGKPIPELWYKRPLYYKGNCQTVAGHGATIPWPNYTDKLDFELEFGIYIGKTGKNISPEDASSYIAGYTIFNDFSARDVLTSEISMLLGPTKGKDMDMGNVMGPFMVTPDEIDPKNLAMEARINGDVWSRGNSSDMYWSFEQIISFVSESETLYPGDFIGSGTVAFGCGDELDKWIKVGDKVELEVEGLGTLTNYIGETEKN